MCSSEKMKDFSNKRRQDWNKEIILKQFPALSAKNAL